MSIGDSLAEARRQAGLSLTQVSQQTRIRESIIRDIEQDDFAGCGGDFYARGHIRSIAAVVGIDPAPLISEYDARHGPPSAMRAAEVFEPSAPIKLRERRSPSLAAIVVVLLLVIIGFSAYHLVSARDAKDKALASSSQAPAPRGTPTPGRSPKAGPTRSPTPSPSPSVTPGPADVAIELAAQEDCWVLITDSGTGSQLFMGTIPAGTTMKWTYKEAVSMELGNPGGVTLTVDGKKQDTNVTQPETLSFSPKAGSSSG